LKNLLGSSVKDLENVALDYGQLLLGVAKSTIGFITIEIRRKILIK